MRWRPLIVVLAIAAADAQAFAQNSGADAAAQNDTLRRELIALCDEDQAVRSQALRVLREQGVTLGEGVSFRQPWQLFVMTLETLKMSAVDARNRVRLKKIIAKHGWPGKTLVGSDGAGSAWLIAQHSDRDRGFQKQCLQAIENAPVGEVERQQIAYLTDRILVGEGKKQRFGTQMDGNFVARPIEDADRVDERRRAMGLEPLAEYLKSAKQAYEEIAKRPSNSADMTDKKTARRVAESC